MGLRVGRNPVETGPIVANEFVFEAKRAWLVDGCLDLDGGDFVDEATDFPGGSMGMHTGVAADAVAQATGFADVEDFGIAREHEVDSGGVWQFAKEVDPEARAERILPGKKPELRGVRRHEGHYSRG